jgi:Fe-S-cluster containining protein
MSDAPIIHPKAKLIEAESRGKSFTLHVLEPADIRPCEGCKACCTALGVQELVKSHYQPCAHECDRGCAIYADRPRSCREFGCWYVAGMVSERPDNIGVIFDYDMVVGVIRAWEVWPGAANEAQAQAVIRTLSRQWKTRVFVITEEIGKAAHDHPAMAKYVKAAEDMAREITLKPSPHTALNTRERAALRRKRRKKAKDNQQGK